MKVRILLLLAALAVSAAPFHAQESATQNQLTEAQKNGRRIFLQRCSICHVVALANGKSFGPTLSKSVVEGNEDFVRKTIADGGEHMPGFQYGLKPTEIDDIVQYLKTVEKPAEGGSAGTMGNE